MSKRMNTITFVLASTLWTSSLAVAGEPDPVIGRTFWRPSRTATGSSEDIKWLKVLGEANANYYEVEYSNGKRDTIWKPFIGSMLDYDPSLGAPRRQIEGSAIEPK
jgi:hypothetical protein